jgi:hypothetical protein
MTANHDLERRIAAFYATEAPLRAPDRVLATALETIDITPQRRALIRVPWRFPPMNTYARVAVAAVAVIAIGAIGLSFLDGRTPGTGGVASPSPTTIPIASPTASPSASTTNPPLVESFTSTIHGISASYPAGWKLQPATEPWPSGGSINEGAVYVDVIYQRNTDSPFLALASQPLAGVDPDVWTATAADFLAEPDYCEAPVPVTVDGAEGKLYGRCLAALVTNADRGYLIWLYRIEDLNRFNEFLATVQLHPEDAVDAAPSGSPPG